MRHARMQIAERCVRAGAAADGDVGPAVEATATYAMAAMVQGIQTNMATRQRMCSRCCVMRTPFIIDEYIGSSSSSAGLQKNSSNGFASSMLSR